MFVVQAHQFLIPAALPISQGEGLYLIETVICKNPHHSGYKSMSKLSEVFRLLSLVCGVDDGKRRIRVST